MRAEPDDVSTGHAEQPARQGAVSGGVELRVVLDTSSLVPPRLRRDLHIAAQAELYTAFWSPWIIAELSRVLTWRWIQHPPGGGFVPDLSRANQRRCSDASHTLMELLLATFRLVEPPQPYPPAWERLTDRWDHPIWAAAQACQAGYVISENTRDFPPRQRDGRYRHAGIEYLTGKAFLRVLAGSELE